MSDIFWQSLFACAIVLIQSLMVWMQNRTENAVVKSAEAAAEKVEEVKQVLDDATKVTDVKLDGLKHEAKKIHGLVDGQMSNQLRLTAMFSRRCANMSQDPADEEVAKMAEQLYRAQVANHGQNGGSA